MQQLAARWDAMDAKARKVEHRKRMRWVAGRAVDLVGAVPRVDQLAYYVKPLVAMRMTIGAIVSGLVDLQSREKNWFTCARKFNIQHCDGSAESVTSVSERDDSSDSSDSSDSGSDESDDEEFDPGDEEVVKPVCACAVWRALK